jgi:hypothetical protein
MYKTSMRGKGETKAVVLALAICSFHLGTGMLTSNIGYLPWASFFPFAISTGLFSWLLWPSHNKRGKNKNRYLSMRKLKGRSYLELKRYS